MTRLLILIFFVNVQALAFGQEIFQRSYGGPGSEYGRAVIECSTGGYAVVGSTNSYHNPGTNIYLLRVDESGDYSWGKSIGAANKITWGIDIAEDEEGDFIIAGYTDNSPSGTYDGLLIKTNSVGEVIWQKTYGGDDWDFIENMVITANGEIILVGQKTLDGHLQGWIMKTDLDGEVIWEKHLESSGQLKITGVDICENEAIVFVGYTSNFLLDTKTFVAGKFTDNGNMVWVSSYPEFGKAETGKCICGNGNKLFTVLTRFFEDGTHDISVNSINTQSGGLNWMNNMGGEHGFGNGIMQKPNGDILFVGTRDGIGFNSYSGNINPYSESGGIILDINSAIVGGYGYDELYDITATRDGGHIAVGETNSFGSNYQVLLCKIDSNGTYTGINIDFVDIATSIPTESAQTNFRIYPNPAINTIYAEFDFKRNTAYRIFSQTGKEVAVGKFENTEKKKIDITSLDNGMYILSFYENKTLLGSTRFIKLP